MKLIKQSKQIFDPYPRIKFTKCEIKFNWPEEIPILGQRYDNIVFDNILYQDVFLTKDLGNNVFECTVSNIVPVILGKIELYEFNIPELNN